LPTEPTPRSGGPAAAQVEPQLVSLYKAHDKIYPRSVNGWFAKWRWALVWLTQIVFYGLPWLSWNGRQAVLFDLTQRRFYIFELVLYPQDFIYLTAILLLSAYGLFFFTAVAGRQWCGYACPQTVYTEIYMWVERKIEGDRAARMRLDKAPWGMEKLARKGGKQLAWILIGLWTGFSFVGYFTPIQVLAAEALSLSFGPWEWFWVLFYGFATYGNAGYMREQVCKYMCPYARFQSAMFDRDTLIVSYDRERGEPRGARSKKADPKALGMGSCVECNLCVQVCPTGIDIRQGLQYECISCAACIDVCDDVMDKFQYPRGLIRYATENGLENHWGPGRVWRRLLRPRVLIYGGLLLLVSSALVWSIATRNTFKVDVVRDRASLARQVEDGQIENIYRLQIMNATEQAQRFELRAAGPGLDGLRLSPSLGVITLGPAEAHWVTLGLRLPPEAAQALKPGAHELRFSVRRLADGSQPEAELHEKSTFVIPR
jgi:cytochrome c oxidase accessory protein FixG